MNPYQKLMNNTVLFGISTFGARFLTFLLTPFYTRILSSVEYGITDLIVQTGNLIIPMAAVGISNGVIRFGLDRNSNKCAVFTTGLVVTITGAVILLVLSPLLSFLSFLSDYVWLVVLYVLMANVHSVCNQFIRTMGHIRLFALDGVLRTVLTILWNILLLAVFPLGVTGYVLANILADGITTVFIFMRAELWRYFHLTSLSKSITVQMLLYSAPLVPTNICGWIINISDRYMIALMVGSAATGIYAISNKIPSVLLTVANVFASAWQLSALAEQSRKEKERFFSNVFFVYSSVAFIVASGVILTAQISTHILASAEFYEAWHYVPLLTIATSFACLGSFLSSIYMVEKRSSAILITTMLGAVVNLIGNYFFISIWGPMGAAVSTLLSYILIFCLRAIHTRTFLCIHWNFIHFLSSVLLLIIQCFLMEYDIPRWPIWCCFCFVGVAAVNYKPLWNAVQKLYILQKI